MRKRSNYSKSLVVHVYIQGKWKIFKVIIFKSRILHNTTFFSPVARNSVPQRSACGPLFHFQISTFTRFNNNCQIRPCDATHLKALLLQLNILLTLFSSAIFFLFSSVVSVTITTPLPLQADWENRKIVVNRWYKLITRGLTHPINTDFLRFSIQTAAFDTLDAIESEREAFLAFYWLESSVKTLRATNCTPFFKI